MTKQTRRRFLKQSSVGVATVGVTVGVLAAAPRLAAVAAPANTSVTALSTDTMSGPLTAYVRDLARGELGVLVGTREVILRDPDLVVRLLKAAQ
jgi:hypothetical protein